MSQRERDVPDRSIGFCQTNMLKSARVGDQRHGEVEKR